MEASSSSRLRERMSTLQQPCSHLRELGPLPLLKKHAHGVTVGMVCNVLKLRVYDSGSRTRADRLLLGRCLALAAVEIKLLLVADFLDFDRDRIHALELALEQFLGKRILDEVLDRTA